MKFVVGIMIVMLAIIIFGGFASIIMEAVLDAAFDPEETDGEC